MITRNTNSSNAPGDEPLAQTNAPAEEVEKQKSALQQQEEPEITRDQLSIRKRLLNWRTIVPLVIVIVALVYFAKQAHINPQQTWAAIRAANIWFVLASFAIYYLSFPLRTLRWRMLLENAGYTKSKGMQLPKFPKLLEILYISWFANAIVPAKLGDLYRAYLLHKEAGLPTSRTLGTILAERLLDLLVLLLLFIPAIIISLHGNLPHQLETGLAVTLILVIAGAIGLFVLRAFPAQIARLVPARFRAYYTNFQEGALGSFRRVPTLIILTVGVWACESLRFFFVAMAFSLIGGNALHIGTAALFIALGEALLTVVPFTGGGLGLVEGGMLAMIALFTANTNLAAAAILTDRTISLFSILFFGFIVFMFAFGRDMRKATLQQKTP
ncbi:MAG TPA: lysylphosphatidylglycerol synthase transmembrane domain-containing protein [Ktedonobacteraceae bacterium]|nr:lysylphosphatidylglycerol synthase transmembrane domain-containing protein [Ktedonobacteraceae bacterium]